MCYFGNDIYEYEVQELELYCKNKYKIDKNLGPHDLRIRCAEIWAYEKAIQLCKEKYYCDPENILFDLGVYFSVAQREQKISIVKNCFEHSYLVIKNMLNFLEHI